MRLPLTDTARCIAIMLCMTVTSPGFAQDLRQRAELGDHVASTPVGADFNEVIAPFALKAMETCAETGLRASAGEMTTLVASVAEDGSWSAVEREQASAVADCLSKELLAEKLPVPQGWDWKQGPFPLTLRLGVGVAKDD